MIGMTVGTIYNFTIWNKLEEGDRKLPASFSGAKTGKTGITGDERIDMSRLEEMYMISIF